MTRVEFALEIFSGRQCRHDLPRHRTLFKFKRRVDFLSRRDVIQAKLAGDSIDLNSEDGEENCH